MYSSILKLTDTDVNNVFHWTPRLSAAGRSSFRQHDLQHLWYAIFEFLFELTRVKE